MEGGKWGRKASGLVIGLQEAAGSLKMFREFTSGERALVVGLLYSDAIRRDNEWQLSVGRNCSARSIRAEINLREPWLCRSRERLLLLPLLMIKWAGSRLPGLRQRCLQHLRPHTQLGSERGAARWLRPPLWLPLRETSEPLLLMCCFLPRCRAGHQRHRAGLPAPAAHGLPRRPAPADAGLLAEGPQHPPALHRDSQHPR